jgi:hypothetical protein
VRTRLAVVILCLALLQFSFLTAAKDAGYTVIYDGGSIPGLKAGEKLKMYIESGGIKLTDEKGKTQVMSIVPSTVTEVSYGQDVHRRVGTAIAVGVFTLGLGALTALSKSKKHFVGLTWATGDMKGGFAMQCDKNDYRGVLAGLEGVTGKKAVDSEARLRTDPRAVEAFTNPFPEFSDSPGATQIGSCLIDRLDADPQLSGDFSDN